MNATIASALLLLPLTAVTAAAQQVISDRVAMSMPSRYEQPACELKSGHFKVSSGATYLKTGIETDIPENKARVWANGRKVLTEAIEQNGQAQNPAAWYYLGRIYFHEGDVAGADSALARAEKGAPECAQDILNYRRNAWVSLIQAGQKFEEQQNPDSAAAMYRQANRVYQRSGIGYYQLASLLNEQGQPDSAAAYFGLAVAGAEGSKDTTELRIRSRSAFNQGAILLNA
ncbi:MAG TPA: tetratricopeptide repeat protein, partial [Gemmatimonadales bacterium]|nr:tetratricopeptide repeat protein [Gemmatimonadales bacterium]